MHFRDKYLKAKYAFLDYKCNVVKCIGWIRYCVIKFAKHTELMLGLWCLTPLSTIFLYLYLHHVSFISGGNQITQREPPICRHWQTLSQRKPPICRHWQTLSQRKPPICRHWQTLSHNIVSCTPCHERDLNSQL
jgi:hypothetical protein